MGGFISAPTNLASPSAIGSTTPNTGRFTTLTLAPSANTTPFTASGYSLTGANAQSFFDLSGTWNTSGTPTAFKLNVTDTASNASSLLMDLQVSGSSRFGFNKSGLMFISDSYCGSSQYADVKIGGGSGGIFLYVANGGNLRVRGNGYLGFSSNTGDASGSPDVLLYRDASAILAQRNSTNAQTFRIYNTFTDASNYERGFVQWSSNVLAIGAEAAGTGTQRSVEFRIGATAVLTLSGTQGTFVSRLSCNNLALGANFIYADPVGNGIRLTDASGSTSASGGYFIYNSYTNTTNNERGFVRWGSNRFQVGTISIGTGTARTCEVTFYTSASDPTSSDITSGYFSVWKNSGTGIVKLWVNDGGTMKSVALV